MPSLPLFFLAYIVLEILALVQAFKYLGVWNALFLLGLAFLAGIFILRQMRSRMLSGSLNNVPRLIFGSMAGVLLIIPGFISDILALLLLLPPVQRHMSKITDRFFANWGLKRIFRFGNMGHKYFGGNFPGFEDHHFDARRREDAPDKEPEFREDIKVTVINRENGTATEQTVTRSRKIDSSKIIDVEIDDGK